MLPALLPSINMVWIVCKDVGLTVLSLSACYYKSYSEGHVTKCCNHLLAVGMGIACRGVVVYVWLEKWQKM